MFRRLVQKGFEERIQYLLLNRKSFMRNVPAVLDEKGYEDVHVKIIRLNYNCKKSTVTGVTVKTKRNKTTTKSIKKNNKKTTHAIPDQEIKAPKRKKLKMEKNPFLEKLLQD